VRWIHRIGDTVLVLISLTACGCLTAETYEVRCSVEPGTGIWTVTHTFWNLGSDSESPEALSSDFEGLMADWKGDEILADTTGGHIVDRDVWVEHDQVCGRLVYLARTIPEEFTFSDDSTGIGTYVPSPTGLLETNGRATPDSSGIVVRWPVDAKEIRIKMHDKGSLHPFSKEQRERILRSGGTKPKE
jgi:hypothetical protein